MNMNDYHAEFEKIISRPYFSDKINGSRKRRIASGSGTTIQDISRLLKQFKQMQKMTKKLGKRGRLADAMKGMG